MIFRNREEAGRYLAEAVKKRNPKSAVIFGIPRGGVVVAVEVARFLKTPLDVIIVRKLGVPFDPELAFGAIGPSGTLALEHEFVERIGLSVAEMESVRAAEEAELKRRESLYRNNLPYPSLEGKVAIIIDDGVATGSTMLVAIRFIKKLNPLKVIAAAPVGAPDALEKILDEAEAIILHSPDDFAAVGQFYEVFPQVDDQKVRKILAEFGL